MKVSVLMITYNHEEFVTQAVESALGQVTNFTYEIVIGEDCSTDRTREILVDLQRKHPGRIRLLLPDHNQGMNTNLIHTLEACRGEYVAWLEGDDFWTSPTKLQRQVDFLDGHPECVSCFHDVVVFDQTGVREAYNYCPPDQKEISDLRDLLVANFIPSCSAMFRRDAVGAIPPWFYGLRMGDWPLHIFCARRGKIGYIDALMGKYRLHGGGVWSAMALSARYQSNIVMFEHLSRMLGPEYENNIRPASAASWQKLAELLIDMGLEQAAREGSVDQVQKMFETWPSDLPLQNEWKTEILGQLFGRLLFASHAQHDLGQVRHWLLRLLRSDLSWLNNRGVRSIALEAIIGPALANGLRRVL